MVEVNGSSLGVDLLKESQNSMSYKCRVLSARLVSLDIYCVVRHILCHEVYLIVFQI